MKRHYDYGNSYTGKHLIGTGLQFRDLIHSGTGRGHADIVLKKEQRVLDLDPQAAGSELRQTSCGGLKL